MGHAGEAAQIAPEIPELFANALSTFRLLGLSGFGSSRILSPGVIEEVQVRRICDVCGHTSGIEEELAVRGRGLAFSLLVAPIIVCLFICCWRSIGDQPGSGLVDGS